MNSKVKNCYRHEKKYQEKTHKATSLGEFKGNIEVLLL